MQRLTQICITLLADMFPSKGPIKLVTVADSPKGQLYMLLKSELISMHGFTCKIGHRTQHIRQGSVRAFFISIIIQSPGIIRLHSGCDMSQQRPVVCLFVSQESAE